MKCTHMGAHILLEPCVGYSSSSSKQKNILSFTILMPQNSKIQSGEDIQQCCALFWSDLQEPVKMPLMLCQVLSLWCRPSGMLLEVLGKSAGLLLTKERLSSSSTFAN